MKKVLPIFEHHSEALLPVEQFVFRMFASAGVAVGLVVLSLIVGMVGYHQLEHLSWLDSFLNSSMLLGGMGPVDIPATEGGKLFAGFYALYSGLAVVLVTGIVLAPVAHRILHRFHIDEREG
jgi:hypothetical protein